MSSADVLKAVNANNFETAGVLSVYDLSTGEVVASYEGMEIYQALVLAQYIVDQSFNMIDVEPPCDPDVITEAKVLFDKIFTDQIVCSLCLREIESVDNEWRHIEANIKHTAIPQKKGTQIQGMVGRRHVDGIWTEYVINYNMYKIQYRLHELQEFSDVEPLDAHKDIELAQARLEYLQKFNDTNGAFPVEFCISKPTKIVLEKRCSRE